MCRVVLNQPEFKIIEAARSNLIMCLIMGGGLERENISRPLKTVRAQPPVLECDFRS